MMNSNLPEPERNRTGTGNKFNFIMRMTVLLNNLAMQSKIQIYRDFNTLFTTFRLRLLISQPRVSFSRLPLQESVHLQCIVHKHECF